MAKMTGFKVYKGTKDSFISSGKAVTYADAIVFITGGTDNEKNSCVFAQGTYFANIHEMIKAIRFVKGVKVGSSSYDALEGGGYIPFASADNSTVSLDVENGTITVGLAEAFVSKVNSTATNLGAKGDAADKDGSAFARIANLAEILGGLTGGSTGSINDQITSAINALRTEIVGALGTDDAATLAAINDELDAIDAKYAALEPRVKAVEDAQAADKAELQGKINGVDKRVETLEGTHATDKAALQGEIDVERKRIDALANDHIGSEEYAALGERITNEAPVTISEAAGSGDILKTYTFTQNGKELGKINIAKELVVTGGDIVVIDGVKNLQLTIANQTAPVNIPVNELVDAYSGSEFVSISDSNVISVDKAGIIAGLATDANAQKYAKDAKDAAIADADGKLANKANSADVYTKSQTYTQTEVNNLLAPKANSADVYTKSQVDAELAKLAVANNVYTKSETNNLLAAKANAADVYTKTEANGLLANKANAADVFTKAEVEAMFAWETIA